MGGRVRPRRKRRMTNNRFGISMGVMRIVIVNAFFQQISKATFAKAVKIARRQIASQLVDSDLQNKPGFLICNGTNCECACEEKCKTDCSGWQRHREALNYEKLLLLQNIPKQGVMLRW